MKFIFSCLIAVILWSPLALAAGSDESPSDSPWGPAMRKALDAEDWTGAINLLERDVAAKIATADTHNYLGYAHRKLGKFDLAFKHYGLALKMNPEHKGANEYLGELHLQMGNLVKAEERLAHLDKVCFFGCEEFDDLKKAIAAYKQKS